MGNCQIEFLNYGQVHHHPIFPLYDDDVVTEGDSPHHRISIRIPESPDGSCCSFSPLVVNLIDSFLLDGHPELIAQTVCLRTTTGQNKWATIDYTRQQQQCGPWLSPSGRARPIRTTLRIRNPRPVVEWDLISNMQMPSADEPHSAGETVRKIYWNQLIKSMSPNAKTIATGFGRRMSSNENCSSRAGLSSVSHLLLLGFTDTVIEYKQAPSHDWRERITFGN